jgi:hypothetical protein
LLFERRPAVNLRSSYNVIAMDSRRQQALGLALLALLILLFVLLRRLWSGA